MEEDKEFRKKPSSSFGRTSIESTKKEEYKKPPAYPYEEKEEKIEKVKEKIAKLEKKPIKPLIQKPKANINILSIIAIILSLIAIILVLTINTVDTTELKGIASDLRTFNHKQVPMTIPLETEFYFEGGISPSQIFKGGQKVPVYFQIPINQTMKGRDVRTGIPVEVKIEENVIVQAEIYIDLTTSNISLELGGPIKAKGNTTSNIRIGDLYGDELNSIAERLDKIAGGN